MNMNAHRLPRLAAALVLLATAPAAAQNDNAATPPDRPLPGITVDRDAGHIDIEAEVVNRDADWLELLVCAPGSREYESILASPARPSHIHLALIMLGLEPGSPLSWQRTDHDNGFDVQPPTGPRLAIHLHWQEDSQDHQAAANTWVVNQKNDRPLAENVWLFAGSKFHEPEDGERVYMADLNGTIITLVNFGDELLTRPTTVTNQTDDQAWSTRTAAIPPEGTAVTIRLTPLADDPEQAPEAEDAPSPRRD